MTKKFLKNFFITMIFLLISVFSFSEIPHQYVVENPSKEIQKIETFKQRDKTEMNLSVTKIRSKEIKDGNISYYSNSKILKISLDKKLYNLENTDKFLVSKLGESIFSINRFKDKNTLKSDTKLCKVNDSGIFKEISLDFEEKPQEIYLTILDKNYNIKEVLNYKNIKEVKDEVIRGETNLYLSKSYSRSFWISFNNFEYTDEKGPQEIELSEECIGVFLKKISGYGLVKMKENDILIINDTQRIKVNSNIFFPEVLVDTKVNSNDLKIKGISWKGIVLREIINTKATVDNYSIKLQLLRDNKLIMEHKFNIHTELFNKVENDVKFEFEIGDYKNEEINLGIIDEDGNFLYASYKGLNLLGRVCYKLDQNGFSLSLDEKEKLKKLRINNQEIYISDENNYPNKVLTLENNLKIEILGGKELTFKLLNYSEDKFSLDLEEETLLNNQNLINKVKINFEKNRSDNSRHSYRTSTNWQIRDSYKGEWIENDYWNRIGGWDVEGLRLHDYDSDHPSFHMDGLGNYSLLPLEGNVESLTVNGINIPQAQGKKPEFSGTLKISEDYIIEYKTKKGYPNIFTYRFIKYPKEDFKLDLFLKFTGDSYYPDRKCDHRYVSNYRYIPSPKNKLTGNSNLEIGKDYKAGTVVRFSGANLEAPSSLSLENPVPLGVILTGTTGYGIPFMKEGDVLQINDEVIRVNKSFTIGSNGNLAQQMVNLATSEINLSVESGKLRFALNKWRTNDPINLNLKLIRGAKEIMEHTLKIKVPEVPKVEGSSNLIIDESYKNEDILFDSCTIDNLKPISLIKPITGVTLNSVLGNGLLTLENNDTLIINTNQHLLTSNNLSEQSLTLGKIKMKYKVVNGKVQLKITEYGLGIVQAEPLTLKINRDGREVMIHTINVTVPNIQKLIGESDLSITDEYKNDYMTIKGCTLNNPQNISFTTSVTGAGINQFTGKGIVKFEAGDILEINGVKSTVDGAGGINEKVENLGGISTSYKAQNGNFQIKINDYQIGQQSPQILNMKLLRANKEIMVHKMKIFVPEIIIDNTKLNVKITDEYKGEYFNLKSILSNIKGLEYLSGDKKLTIYTPSGSYNGEDYFNYLNLNGNVLAKKRDNSIKASTLNLKGVTVNIQNSSDLMVSLSNYLKKISVPFELIVESSYVDFQAGHDYGGSNTNHNGTGSPDRYVSHIARKNIVFYYVPTKVIGQSTLEVREYYPTPEYIAFNSCTTPDPKPIKLENSLRDVKVIQNTGNGLVNLEQGDILELNNKQYTINAGGNLVEQDDTLGDINFKFKVENGKIRLALKNWGILEPDRILTINASREGHPIMQHTMTIKAPRRVEGTSDLKLNQDYMIRNIINFNGMNLDTPTSTQLEEPIPSGVLLTGTSGQGMPFMKEGDILQIDDGLTRAVKSFTLGANGNLAKQKIKLKNGELSLFVEDGKLRIGVNNWLVNKSISLKLRILRGNNKIMDHILNIKVPEAPFNIKKNGILDFGNVTSGIKRTAETDIILEMLKDVSDVKFTLKDPQPIMENLSTKEILKVNKIEYLVSKQGERDYKVKLKGNLTIPEATKSGLYTGSTVLELKIK